MDDQGTIGGDEFSDPGEPPLLQSTLQGHHLPVDLHADLIFKFYQQGLIAHVM